MFLQIPNSEALGIIQRMTRESDGLLKLDAVKFLADKLEVHPRTIYKWSVRESVIPPEREEQIPAALAALGLGAPQLLKETADAMARMAKADADDQVTTAEAIDCVRELDEVIVAAELIKRAMLARAGL